MIYSRPGLQRKCTAAALSQAGRAGPDQPIRAIRRLAAHAARQPDVRDRQTDVRQHHRLMPPGRGHNNTFAFRQNDIDTVCVCVCAYIFACR